MRDQIKSSEVREDFFYEQCHIQIWNRENPDRVFSAPCIGVKRGDREVCLDFDPIPFSAEIEIHCFRIIGGDGLSLREGDWEPYAKVRQGISMACRYEMFWDDDAWSN